MNEKRSTPSVYKTCHCKFSRYQGKWEYPESGRGRGCAGNSGSHAKRLEIRMAPDFLTASLEPEDSGLIPSEFRGKLFTT